MSEEAEKLARAVESILIALDRLNKRLHDVENAVNYLAEPLGLLTGKGQYLQVENEVHKIELGALKTNLLRRERELAEDVLETLDFISRITETQIKGNENWNDGMLKLFQEKTAQNRKTLEELLLKGTSNG